jgi:hypothetical protein
MPGLSIHAKLRAESFETFLTKSSKLQNAPNQSVPIQYGAKKQYAMQESTASLLDDKAKQFIQQVCGKFLFLGRAVDSTLLCPISAIASQSSKPTEETMLHTLQLLHYLAMQEDAVLSYHASDLVLAVYSNASYLSKPKAQSQVGGHFFLSSIVSSRKLRRGESNEKCTLPPIFW